MHDPGRDPSAPTSRIRIRRRTASDPVPRKAPTVPVHPAGPPAGPPRPIGVQARGLTKSYAGLPVVEDLSFTAAPGVITGFLGPNGAGKSTTIRMLLGLVEPTSGAITIDGLHITELDDPAHVIGALLDARAVHPARRAYDHLLAFSQAAGLGRDRVDEVLDLVGLTTAAGRRAGEFSLGMTQRLGIATALLGDPRVLVLDEPLNGLDPEGIRWMRTLLRDLAAEGRTILFSSHLMSEMELVADDLVVIARGRLLAESSLAEFVRANANRAVTVSAPSRTRLARALHRSGLRFEGTAESALLVHGTDPSTVGAIAAAEGVALDELTWARESLEDIFLRITGDATTHQGRAA